MSFPAILAQSRFETQFVSQADTNTIILAVVLIVGFVVALGVGGAISSRNRSSGSGTGARYSKSAFRRKARQMGLTKAHIGTLDFVREKYQVKNPMALLTNSKQLDFYLNKTITDIDLQVATEDMKEAQKLTLYRIKQIIERNTQKSVAYTSTKQLKSGQRITLAGAADGVRYPSRIVAVLKDAVAAEAPADDGGSPVRWKKWSPVDVFFWKPNGEGFSFQTKVTAYNTVKSVPSVFLQHTNKIQSAKQRRFRRKSLESPCYFYPVRVLSIGSGRNQEKRAYVDAKHRVLGTIVEVSAGGCSIRTSRALPKQSLVKVDFEAERSVTISSYGKIMNVRKESPSSTIMHIMFTRVSRKNLNLINSFVYEYGIP